MLKKIGLSSLLVLTNLMAQAPDNSIVITQEMKKEFSEAFNEDMVEFNNGGLKVINTRFLEPTNTFYSLYVINGEGDKITNDRRKELAESFTEDICSNEGIRDNLREYKGLSFETNIINALNPKDLVSFSFSLYENCKDVWSSQKK